jgi:hypothetical protein
MSAKTINRPMGVLARQPLEGHPWHYNVTFAKRGKSGRWIEPTVAVKANSPGEAITIVCAKHGIERRSVSHVVAITPAPALANIGPQS